MSVIDIVKQCQTTFRGHRKSSISKHAEAIVAQSHHSTTMPMVRLCRHYSLAWKTAKVFLNVVFAGMVIRYPQCILCQVIINLFLWHGPLDDSQNRKICWSVLVFLVLPNIVRRLQSRCANSLKTLISSMNSLQFQFYLAISTVPLS